MSVHNTRQKVTGFESWEVVQGVFRVGIRMPDDTMADGIGRCASLAEFARKAEHSAVTILRAD